MNNIIWLIIAVCLSGCYGFSTFGNGPIIDHQNASYPFSKGSYIHSIVTGDDLIDNLKELGLLRYSDLAPLYLNVDSKLFLGEYIGSMDILEHCYAIHVDHGPIYLLFKNVVSEYYIVSMGDECISNDSISLNPDSSYYVKISGEIISLVTYDVALFVLWVNNITDQERFIYNIDKRDYKDNYEYILGTSHGLVEFFLENDIKSNHQLIPLFYISKKVPDIMEADSILNVAKINRYIYESVGVQPFLSFIEYETIQAKEDPR